MKIAYVYDTIYPYTFGGVEKRIWELSVRLARKGHEIHIFGPKFWEGDSIIQKEGIYLHGVCNPPKDRFKGGRRSITWPIFFSLWLLFPLLKVKFDIIDCQNFPYFPCYSAKIVSIMRRTPLVITWHEVWADYWYEYLGKIGILGKLIEKMTASLKCTMIAVSDLTKRDLEAIGTKKSIKVITNGIDLESIRKIEPSLQLSDIIFTGRQIKEKNLDILIKSINLLTKDLPDIKVIIIGDGPEKGAIERLIDDLGLGNNVIMLGRVEKDEQVYAYMKSSRVFISLSTREGFGIVALEANGCGLPVITIKHPRNAICDLITESENGFICGLTEEDLAEKVLTAKALGENMRQKCLESAEDYDWGKIASEIDIFYSEIVN